MLRIPLKLQRVRTRTVGDKDYFKNQVTLPGDLLDELGWKHGTDLNVERKGDSLVLRKVK